MSGIGEDRKLRTPDVREKVEKFISECSKQLSSILSSKYLYSPLYAKIMDREVKRLNEINKVVIDSGGITEQIKTLDFDEFKQDVHISLDGMVNIEHLVPWLSTFHRHDRAMISRYLYSISDILVGKEEPTGNVTKSYLELTVIPSILNQIQSDYKKAMKERSEECSEYLKRVRTKRLSMVIKDLASFEEELEVLKSLKENLMNMK